MPRRVRLSAACAVAVALATIPAGAGAGARTPLARHLLALADDRPIVGQPHADLRNGEIVVLDTRTGRRTNVSRAPEVEDEDPVWSPDGSMIAWIRPRHIADGAIWAMRPNGSGQHRIVAEHVFGRINWSSDGREIAFLDASGGHVAFAAVSVETGEKRVLAPLDQGARDPVWSPDGSQLALLTPGPASGQTSVLILDVRGGARRLPLQHAGAFTHWAIDWSPDGRRLAVTWAANDMPRTRLTIVDLATEVATDHTVESLETGGATPEWSPDSARVAVSVDGLVVLVDATTGVRRELVRGASSAARPAWSPDGRAIAVRSEAAREVIVARLDGAARALRAAEEGGSVTSDPSWDAAGRRLVYATRSEENDRELFLVSANGSHVRQLTRNTVEDRDPAWSRNGAQLAFVRSEKAGQERIDGAVYVLAPGRRARRLTSATGAGSPTWSPNGREIAFERDGAVLAVRVADGHTRAITAGHDPAWSPDGRLLAVADGQRLVVVRPSRRGRRVIFRATARVGGTTEVHEPVWHPSGRFVHARVSEYIGCCTFDSAVIVPRVGGRARPARCQFAAWSPDGRWLACGSGEIVVSDAGSARPAASLRGDQAAWRPARAETRRGRR